MRKIAALLVFVIPTFTHAGDYEEALYIATRCEFLGDVGAGSFTAKQTNGRTMSATKETAGMLYPLVVFAVNYGYNIAVDKEEAYNVSYGKCLDNYEWLARRIRDGKPIPDGLLY